MKITEIITEAVKQRLDPKCWKGKHKEGTKIKGGIRVNNCVPNESVEEAANAAQQAAIAIAKKKKKGVAEGSKPDAYGRTGEKHECGSCDGTGIDTHDDECSECGGKGWVRDKESLKKQGVAEGVDIGQEWMSDTELDQYVPDRLQQQWRELLGYDEDGNPSALWANLTGGYEPDINDPQHRALMVKVANKWFAAKKIPNVKFFNVKDSDDELEWLVQIGQQGVAEGLSLDEQFDVIEAMVEAFALYHGVDSEQIWEDFESVDDSELLDESAAWKRSAGKSKKGGLNAKGVASYRRENPGSKLQMAVTTKPSKLKPGSKAAKRRKSFCARMGGNPGPMKKPNGKPTRKALALRKWNC